MVNDSDQLNHIIMMSRRLKQSELKLMKPARLESGVKTEMNRIP